MSKPHKGECTTACSHFEKPTPSLGMEAELDRILNTKPAGDVPDDVWGSLYATWTGIWTDSYGKWDERQASDLFPISDLLSEKREKWLKAQLQALIARKVRAALLGAGYEDCQNCGELKPRYQATHSAAGKRNGTICKECSDGFRTALPTKPSKSKEKE